MMWSRALFDVHLLQVTGLQSGLAKGSALTAADDGLSGRKHEVDAKHLDRVGVADTLQPSKKRRTTGQKTAGKGWFNMKTPAMTDELKEDLNIIKMRNYLDPKRHMRTNDWAKRLPKHFQVGTVVEDKSEWYSSRLTKKERHDRMVDAVLAEPKTKAYVKRTFNSINEKAQAGRKKYVAKKKHARYGKSGFK